MNASGNISLGDLMLKSSLVSKQDLDEALQIGKETGMRVGQVLIVSGFITARNLQATQYVQSMVRGEKITLDEALSVLRLIKTENLTLESALARLHIAQNIPLSLVEA